MINFFAGVIGILLFIIGVMAYVISSARLTDCCSILREKYYNNSLEMPYCKNPYIMIAHHAFGSFARLVLVSILIEIPLEFKNIFDNWFSSRIVVIYLFYFYFVFLVH